MTMTSCGKDTNSVTDNSNQLIETTESTIKGNLTTKDKDGNVLLFAVVFLIVGILRYNVNNWIDTGFFILAVICFVITFFTTNKNN